MSPRRGAWLLAAGAGVLGASVLVAPEAVMSRWLGPENARNGAVKDARARPRGTRHRRSAVASVQTLDDPVIGPRVLVACACADGVDALATLIERDSLPPVGAAGTVAVAAGAAVAGLYFAHRLARDEA